MKNIFSIGLGLVGGSIAMNFRRIMPQAIYFGIDNNLTHSQEALDLGIIDKKADINQVSKADMVILSIPSDATIQVLLEVLDLIPDTCIVIDTASTKYNICEAVQSHSKRKNFVASHPIAGTEFSGPKAAFLELFRNKTNIICDSELTDAIILREVKHLFFKMKMKTFYMDSKSHDLHIAYVSHLSHITSFMLCRTVIEKEKNHQRLFDMAGSGFESTVRLAKSSPETWTAIFKENKVNVLESLSEYISNLKNFESLLQKEDFESIYSELENTNRIKTILKEIANQ